MQVDPKRIAAAWLETVGATDRGIGDGPRRVASDVVQMTIWPMFYINKDLRDARRVRFVFGVSGTERQGTLYVNTTLSVPFEKALAEHLSERWNRYVHRSEYAPGDVYVGPKDSTFIRGALLRDATKAAQVVGRRAGAHKVELRSIEVPTR